MATQRLDIFIDGGYIFNVFQRYRSAGYKYSCKRLARRLSENYNLVKVYYIDSINQRDPALKAKQERFFYGQLRDALGWETIVLPLQRPGGKAAQKGTDAALMLNLHNAAVKDEYDTAILLTADSDFCPAVELVKQAGRIVRNAYFSARPSFHLQQACNGTPIRLDDVDFVYHRDSPQSLLCLSSIPLKSLKVSTGP